MPRPLVPLCCAFLALAGDPWSADQPPPGELPPPIRQLTAQASRFWGAAPSWYCRETLRQRGPHQQKQRHGIHFSEPPKPNPSEIADREIVSWYGFSAYTSNSEAVHEMRQIVSVDGKPVSGGQSADAFCRLLLARDDASKQKLVERFENATLGDVPFDFGQLVLLFTRRAIDRYSFQLKGPDLIGAQRVAVFQYSQNTGTPGLHLDQNKTLPLAGTLSLREPDGAPVRITVVAARQDKGKVEIRDEAEVDYEEVAHGVILPASLVHRRFVNGALHADDRAQYSDWKPVREPKANDAK
ncbi:MAG: hypothetical protein ABSH47_17665 [Bryobacteraceae bacterium]|jgi:hypothetical protein